MEKRNQTNDTVAEQDSCASGEGRGVDDSIQSQAMVLDFKCIYRESVIPASIDSRRHYIPGDDRPDVPEDRIDRRPCAGYITCGDGLAIACELVTSSPRFARFRVPIGPCRYI